MNLKDLIALHKGGRSYAKLARDCGGELTSGRLQQMATGELKEWPKPRALRALASGLHVTESVVVLAAAESLDLDTRRAAGPLEDFLPAGVEQLTEDQMRAIGALIHSIVNQREGGQSDAGQAEAQKTAEQEDVTLAVSGEAGEGRAILTPEDGADDNITHLPGSGKTESTVQPKAARRTGRKSRGQQLRDGEGVD